MYGVCWLCVGMDVGWSVLDKILQFFPCFEKCGIIKHVIYTNF